MPAQLPWSTIATPSDAPTTCGVYQYWSGSTLLYIGKAINLKARLLSHAQNAKLDKKEAAIVSGDIIRYTLCDTEFKALLLEAKLIRDFRPPHNRIWKDDKSYLYIIIDMSDPYPRPRMSRAHDLARILSKPHRASFKIFGPFPAAHIAEEVLRGIRRLIPFCMSKTVGKRACFYSRIGLCSPCPGEIAHLKEGVQKESQKRRYRSQIRRVAKILNGGIDPVIKSMSNEMKQASTHEDFEAALVLRNRIERFERFIVNHSFTDRHFSYNRSAEKLSALQAALSPYIGESSLTRIECYDASNSAMTNAVVSLVVMTDGLIDKGQYRRFRVKNPNARSDFDRLEEALVRRLKKLETPGSWGRPGLVVIDGGVPQLRRMQKVFDKLPNKIMYIGLAKHPDRLIIPDDKQTNAPAFITLRLPADHPGLQLLAQLRDESHRFANAYRNILVKKEVQPKR